MINKLLSGMLAIVIGVSLIPTVMTSVDDADTATTTENFTATTDETTAETFTLENMTLNDEVNYVNVNSEEIDASSYTVTGSDVELNAAASTTDDSVAIDYDYSADLGSATETLIDLLPILFVVILVSGAVAYIRFRD